MKFLFLIFSFILSGCNSIIEDSSAFSSFEARAPSMVIKGCDGFGDQAFLVCRGQDLQQVDYEVEIFFPDYDTKVEISGCGSTPKEFFPVRKSIAFKVSDFYGESWDLNKRCLIQILAKTYYAEAKIAFFEANIYAYGYKAGYLPTPGAGSVAQRCILDLTTKGRTKVTCSKL